MGSGEFEGAEFEFLGFFGGALEDGLKNGELVVHLDSAIHPGHKRLSDAHDGFNGDHPAGVGGGIAQESGGVEVQGMPTGGCCGGVAGHIAGGSDLGTLGGRVSSDSGWSIARCGCATLDAGELRFAGLIFALAGYMGILSDLPSACRVLSGSLGAALGGIDGSNAQSGLDFNVLQFSGEGRRPIRMVLSILSFSGGSLATSHCGHRAFPFDIDLSGTSGHVEAPAHGLIRPRGIPRCTA